MNAIIAWMVRNRVAANLLMVFIIAAGLLSAAVITVQLFPDIELARLEIRVEYPGASPVEIEESIVKPIEEAVESVEGIREMTSTASEGLGVVAIELVRGENVSRRRDEVKSQIDRIRTLPDNAEEPEVRQMRARRKLAQLMIYGDVAERTLKELAYRVKDDLTHTEQISIVELSGARDYELSIEVSNDTLRAYGMTLEDLALIIRRESLELPGGEIETPDQEVVLRTVGRNYVRRDFEEIVVLTGDNGAQVRLGDIATVRDGFQEQDVFSLYNGKPSVALDLYRVGDEQVLDVSETAQAYLENQLLPSLPPGVEAVIWQNDALELGDRLSLIVKNAMIGLFLVIGALTFFLDLRLAFWTSLGILVSFVGSLAILSGLDVSLNQMSTMGFILAIGIVVDDAIVVGENIYAVNESGARPLEAAIRGAQRISKPIFFAVATTLAAFGSLLTLPGELGRLLSDIPTVVIAILALSLVEAILILPHHLSYLRVRKQSKDRWEPTAFVRMHKAVSSSLQRFTEGPLDRALHFVTAHPWITIMTSLTTILLAVGLVAGGHVKFQFFPEIQGQQVTVSVELPPGATASQTLAVAERLERVAQQVGVSLQAQLPEDSPTAIVATRLLVGQEGLTRDPMGGEPGVGRANLGSVLIELLPPENRLFSATEFAQMWRQAAGTVPEARRVYFSSSMVNLGPPVQVELTSSSDTDVAAAVDALVSELRKLGGVMDVRSDLDEGKRELKLELRPEARTFGLSLEALARQVRAAFFGAEALRVQREREELKVYVRLPKDERSALASLDEYRIRSLNGFIPLRDVAQVSEGLSPPQIARRDGRRIVTVTADVDRAATTSGEVATYLIGSYLPQLQARYPDLRYAFGGEQREMARSGPIMIRNVLLALLVIYALLAVAFQSYVQPVIIMAAIPFGVIGAILGHMIMGISMTMISLFGMVGLSGVIINGALVMIDFINEERDLGRPPREAIIHGAKSRFRPIFLTSLTTFLGVAPLIFERSMQAQFIVPIAVSIGFGVLFGTAILMLLVPALAMLESPLEHFAAKEQSAPG